MQISTRRNIWVAVVLAMVMFTLIGVVAYLAVTGVKVPPVVGLGSLFVAAFVAITIAQRARR